MMVPDATVSHAPSRVLRVVIGEDDVLVRAGLAAVLDAAPDIEIVGAFADQATLLAGLRALEPDVLVTDVRMPPTGTDEGIRTALEVRERHPAMGVVVLSQHLEARWVLRLLGGGSAGCAYILKEHVADEGQLARAIREVAAGGTHIDRAIVDSVIRPRSTPSPLDDLTPRELEVLAEIAEGKSNAAIAAHLVLEKRTVEKHIGAIFTKLALPPEDVASRRVQAVLLYLDAVGRR